MRPRSLIVIRAIIFDLGNCISAADSMGQQLFTPVFDAIRQRNEDRFSEQALDAIFFDCWGHPLDWVAERYGFSPEMLAAAWELSSKLEVTTPMRAYPDLEAVVKLPVMRFLVTSGFRRLQQSKVEALQLHALFTETHIDAIDEKDRKGKQQLFAEIMERHHLDRGDVLVVGDNPNSEIEAGNRLGVRTVQILRPGVPPGHNATYTITTFEELRDLIG